MVHQSENKDPQSKQEELLSNEGPIKKCRKCGRTLPQDSSFCQYCGERFDTILKQEEEKPVVEKKNKEKKSAWKIAAVIFVLVAVLLVGGSYLMYRLAYSAVAEMDFRRAAKINLLPSVTNIYDKNINAYIYAGNLLLDGDSYTASKMFSDLDPYLDAKYLEMEADYRYANELIARQSYSQALRILTSLSQKNYSSSAARLSNLKEHVYQEAVNQYNKGYGSENGSEKYSTETLFEMIPGYKDTEKYLILLDARSSAERYNRNSFGLSSRGISKEQFNSLISILHFGDAKEIIMMSQSGAEMFLEGTWKTADNRFYFSMDNEGSTQYNLPATNMANSYYHIEKGLYFLYGQDKDWRSLTEFEKQKEARFYFEIIDLNSVNVYCYKDSSRYTLYRQQ